MSGVPARPTLIAIDLQRIFAAGPWGAPGFVDVVAPVQRLEQAIGAEHSVFTRFVAPAQPEGSWVPYYKQWPFALQPPDAPDFQLVEEFAGRPTLDAPTFGKWEALRAGYRFAPGADLVVCGVSTDCCVIATVLAAADDGMTIRVVTDACAGVDDDTHRKALDVMALFTPQVRLVTSDQVLATLS